MPYIIKTEINGIQDFIFNIKTKGAAKALKARSYLIDAACELIEKIFCNTFPACTSIYTGGGNVTIEVPDTQFNRQEFDRLLASLAGELQPYNILLSGCAQHFTSLDNFSETLQEVNNTLGAIKLRYGIGNTMLFEAVQEVKKDQQPFIDFSKQYAGHKRAVFIANAGSKKPLVEAGRINLGGYQLQLQDSTKQELIPLPVWTSDLLGDHKLMIEAFSEKEDDFSKPEKGNIIGFNFLAGFAKERTGTGKIAVLKLDVDNLGGLFRQTKSRKANTTLSKAVKDFFTKDIIALLDESFTSVRRDEEKPQEIRKALVKGKTEEIKAYCKKPQQYLYRNNIYTVYAGGDDCFFIGAWDALAEFAIDLQQKFAVFEAKLRGELKLSPERLITLSAAYIVIDPHYPVVRFAEVIEDALKDAKFIGREEREKMMQAGQVDAAGLPLKNKISFMGHTFTWPQFTELVAVKDQFHNMALQFDTPSTFYQRIINAFTHVNNSYWQQCKPSKPFNPAILWRFLYSFRDIQHKNYFSAFYYDTFFSESNGYYRKYVWNNFEPGRQLSAVLPVAARWTELLIRSD